MHHHNIIEPFQIVGFDCLGPMKETVDQKIFVILGRDMFTRFLDGKAVKSIESNSYAKFLLSSIHRFGVPKGILSNNARTFVSKEVTNITETFNISHYKSTSHHSQGNSLAERALQSLQVKLSIVKTNDSLDERSRALPNAILSLNTSVHKTTGFPLFLLMFGRTSAMSSKLTSSAKTVYELQVELITQTHDNSLAEAVANQSDAQAASRPYFETNHTPRSFEIGDLVSAKRFSQFNVLFHDNLLSICHSILQLQQSGNGGEG